LKKDNIIYDNHEPITETETKYMEMCYNGGLIYFDGPGTYKCKTFDKTSFYPSMLGAKTAGLKIPNKPGKEVHLDTLPDKLLPGFYMANITINDNDVFKTFSLSKDNCYTHQSISAARFLSRTYDIDIELIQNGEPNAYVYKDTDMVYCRDIFRRWFLILIKTKRLYPKNKLIKFMLSSMWGHLSQKNDTKKVSENDIDNYPNSKIVDILFNEDGSYTYAIVINGTKTYKTNYRIKCFLTACGRTKIGNIAKKYIDCVQTIHTDGITFKNLPKGHKLCMNEMKIEYHKYGLLKWHHVNKFDKLD
jgi:hypothetical protein